MKLMKKTLAVFLAAVMAFCVMSVSVFAEEEATGTAISYVGITVEAPLADCYASGNYVLDSEEYEFVDMMWADAVTGEMLYLASEGKDVAEVPFAEGSVYTVKIALKAADGYLFELDAEELVVSVNGYAAEIEEISGMGKLLVVSCDFECTGEDIDIGDDDTNTGINFDKILELLKTVLLTIVRFFGALIGIK